ncbi:MAG: cytochrome c biogenesis protein CcdA, partial [Actinobacteria bacterium]|nr:cytochrome c biogenesis protein CcdA [Actinomycetota bacterium]
YMNRTFADGLLHGGVILGCIGPQLAAILSFIVALQSISQGVLMIIFFALGFMFPFLIFALIITDRSIQSRLLKQANLVQKIGGILMITAASYLLYFSFQGFI